MHGDSILSLTVPESTTPQHLSLALRECVDVYLRAAQCGNREVILLWPGAIDCLPLVHAIATIECWANGYKQGLRAVTYPATTATFRRLNHVFVDRDDVLTMNNEVREVAFTGVNPAVRQKCEKKDLMLYALAGIKEAARAAGLQPCLNELLPHFYLETGERGEVARQSYRNGYLSHILTKLSRAAQAKALRETTLPGLADAPVAPDAVFALSHKMTKRQIEQALSTLKDMGKVDVLLLDATRSAFERTEKLSGRLATVVRLADEVYGPTPPGIVIITNDPRQMTQLRAALTKEAQGAGVNFRFGATLGLCHPTNQENDIGLQPTVCAAPSAPGPAAIKVEITDRESAKLVNQAYRYSRDLAGHEVALEALNAASKFLRTMANLPSSASLLHEWLDEAMAEDTQRRSFDWVAQRNCLKATLDELPPDMRANLQAWIAQVTAVLNAQEAGTPLARAMVSRVKARATAGGNVLVVLASGFYARLANAYFLRDPDTEPLRDSVRFTSTKLLRSQITTGWPNRLVVCALSPDLLRWTVTSETLPGTVDFLLTQQTALGARYALEPVLGLKAFQPYFSRVHAIYDPIKSAQGAIGAIMPDYDYQAPTFSPATPSPPGTGGVGERGPTDVVQIQLDDGRPIFAGRRSVVYRYDPAAPESRTMGFRRAFADELVQGDQIFVMSEEMRDQVEETFAEAGVPFAEAIKYESLLRQYHTQVLTRVHERFPGNVAEAARKVREAMRRVHPELEPDLSNVRYWINLKRADGTPANQLLPQAPRHFATFNAFMEALGFESLQITIFWDGAVKRWRGTRISDGLNLSDHYERVLFDPRSRRDV